jgi:hypothetical protein
MKKLFLSLVLSVAALGIFAMPSTAEAHPGRAHVAAYHYQYRRPYAHAPAPYRWREVHRHWDAHYHYYRR